MTAESVSIALSAATLLVIAATAIAAMVQLRHLRASNQIEALIAILDQWTQPAIRAAYAQFEELPAKIADPEYGRRMGAQGSHDRQKYPELLVFDFWEQVGTYVKHGLLDERIVLDIVSTQVSNAWRRAAPVVDIMRRRGGDSVFENFEYFAVRARFYHEKYPNGNYPQNTPRWAALEGAANTEAKS